MLEMTTGAYGGRGRRRRLSAHAEGRWAAARSRRRSRPRRTSWEEPPSPPVGWEDLTGGCFTQRLERADVSVVSSTCQ
jgi:hypothetical protein